MAWNNPQTWAAGPPAVTAADLNRELRDNMKALTEWQTTWTPNWSATTTNPVIGNGTLVGRYISAGKLVHFYVQITMGSTTTFGSGTWQLDLPVAEASRRFLVTGVAFDTSVPRSHPIAGERTGSDVLTLRQDGGTAFSFNNVTNTTPFIWATGDELYIGGTYEAS